MHTIAIFNTRGGSGKSAATVFLADFLATAFRKRVLVVDLDPQQSSSVALLGEERLYEAFEREKSLALLMQRAYEDPPRPNVIQYYLIERPRYEGRKGIAYLDSIHVLACERESWHDLDDRLIQDARSHHPARQNILRNLLAPLDDDFDICLLDFPGHEVGPIARNGLRAADWWLFPCVPDRAGTRDIEGPVKAIKQACQNTEHQIRGLGTLLSICQQASGSQFRRAVSTLTTAAERGIIPKLFEKKARLLNWTSARNALDDTSWKPSTTLAQKYKEKPLYNAMQGLSKQLLGRLGLPADQVRLELGLLDGLNSMFRKIFAGSGAG